MHTRQRGLIVGSGTEASAPRQALLTPSEGWAGSDKIRHDRKLTHKRDLKKNLKKIFKTPNKTHLSAQKGGSGSAVPRALWEPLSPALGRCAAGPGPAALLPAPTAPCQPLESAGSLTQPGSGAEPSAGNPGQGASARESYRDSALSPRWTRLSRDQLTAEGTE